MSTLSKLPQAVPNFVYLKYLPTVAIVVSENKYAFHRLENSLLVFNFSSCSTALSNAFKTAFLSGGVKAFDDLGPFGLAFKGS